jgi:hypothetical protein
MYMQVMLFIMTSMFKSIIHYVYQQTVEECGTNEMGKTVQLQL